MPAHSKITQEVQIEIESLLTLWRGKLTWELLTEKLNSELGLKVSRQTLKSYESIYQAFTRQKALQRGFSYDVERKISSEDIGLVARIEKLEAELAIKTRIINEQKRFLQRIMQNATEISSMRGKLDLLVKERAEDQE
jgi:hypothetical protein